MLFQTSVAADSEYVQFCHGRLADPYPLLHRLRTEDPVHWSELLGSWVITRYEDVRSGLRDPHMSSARVSILMNRLPATMQDQVSGLGEHLAKWVSLVNPPDHTRLRRLVDIAFTPKMIDRMRPRMQAIIDSLLDQVESRGQMDVIKDFAYPLPATIISQMLGVPAEDQARFGKWSDEIMAFLGGSPLTLYRMAERADRSLRELTEYFQSIISARKSSPRDDLVSALTAAEEQGDKLSAAETIAMCSQLLTAGHETTTQLIANGTLSLLQHPDEIRKLRENPDLTTSGVEEVLRFEGPSQRQTRLAGEGCEVGGRSIKKGATILFMLGAANRDPAEFPDPDRFDIGRKPNRHVAFAAGIHTCLGAPLARLEGAIAINSLLRRFPSLQLATQGLQWRENMTLRGLKSLDVTF